MNLVLRLKVETLILSSFLNLNTCETFLITQSIPASLQHKYPQNE
jgi:hypothetical protein